MSQHNQPEDMTHDQIRNLLARYSEIETNGRDASRMYPQVARHLQRCRECRHILEDLAESELSPLQSIHSQEVDLSFLQTQALSHEQNEDIHPGAVTISFDVTFNDYEPATRSVSSMHGFGAVQQGGELLFAGSVQLGSEDAYIVLTRHTSLQGGIDSVSGNVHADRMPSAVMAHLKIGDKVYTTQSTNGTIHFEQVTFTQDLTSITLTLEPVI